MDNKQQIKEIKRYRDYLCRIQQRDIDLNTAAHLWVDKYAKLWRLKHETR